MEVNPELTGQDDFKGSRVFSSTILVNGSLRFDAGVATYMLDGDKHFIQARGNKNQSGTPISSDYVTSSLDLSVSLPVTPKEGQWVRIVSDAVNIYDRSRIGVSNKYRTQEFAAVAAGSTSSTVKLQSPLRFTVGTNSAEDAFAPSYTTSNNTRVVLMDDREVFEWTGGRFVGADGVVGVAAPVFELVAYVKPRISGISVRNWYGSGVNLIGTLFADISQCNFADLADAANQNGYGICDGGWYTSVSDCSVLRSRHAYTTLQRSLADNTSSVWSGGFTVGAVISGCVSYLATASHFDTHHASLDITFRDCQAIGGDSAYSGRGVNVLVSGCRSRSTQRAISVLIESGLTAGQSPRAIPSFVFDGCDLESVGSQGAVSASLSRVYFTGRNTVRCCGWRQFLGSSAEVSVSGMLEFITTTGTAGEPIVNPSASYIAAFTIYTDGGYSGGYGIGSSLTVERTGMLRLDARAFSSTSTGLTNLFLFPANTSLRNLGSIEVQTSTALPAYVFDDGNGTVVSFPDSALVISTNLSAGAKFSGKGRVFRPDGTVVV